MDRNKGSRKRFGLCWSVVICPLCSSSIDIAATLYSFSEPTTKIYIVLGTSAFGFGWRSPSPMELMMLIKIKKEEIFSCLSFFFSGFGWIFAVVSSQTYASMLVGAAAWIILIESCCRNQMDWESFVFDPPHPTLGFHCPEKSHLASALVEVELKLNCPGKDSC